MPMLAALPKPPPPPPLRLVRELEEPFSGAGVVQRSGVKLVRAVNDEGGLIGSTLAGRYQVTALLGRGATSQVCEARDLETGGEVALKIIRPRLGDPRVRRRFDREALAMKSVTHPGLVRLLDAGELEGGELYLAMELVRGKTLREVMRTTKGVRSTRAIIALLRPVAAALDAIHRAGLVHRDVKPENIVVGEDGTARLIDLGIAFSDDDRDDRITSHGHVVGSPRYVSPEATTHGRPAAAWDVYALGVLLFEVIAGDAPFRGRAFDVLRQKGLTDAPSLAQVAGHLVSISLELVMRRALDRNPARRPPSATALLDWTVAALDDAFAQPA